MKRKLVSLLLFLGEDPVRIESSSPLTLLKFHRFYTLITSCQNGNFQFFTFFGARWCFPSVVYDEPVIEIYNSYRINQKELGKNLTFEK